MQNESPLPNVDVDMIINESTPLLLLHQEIEESELSTLHKQISNYYSELKNVNSVAKFKVSRHVLKLRFSVSKI